MEAKQLAELPIVFQIIAGFGIFFGTFMLAIGGWLWKTIKPKLLNAVVETVEPAPPKDTLVLSAAIADSKAISNLAGAIEKLLTHLGDDSEDRERQSVKTYNRLGDLNDNLERIHETLCRVERQLKERTLI